MECSLLTNEKPEKNKNLYEKYLSKNWETESKKRLFIIRIIGVFIILLVVFMSKISFSPDENLECINDRVFDLTRPINNYYRDNPTNKNMTIILSSFLIDIAMVLFIFYYGLFGDSWRELIFGTMFYSTRGFLQAATILGFPKDFIWGYPGIHSFLITYVKSSDFFYSGHVGIMFFLSIYFKKVKNTFLSYYCLFCSIAEAYVVVITRSHYTIDVIGGMVFVHYFWIMSSKVSKYADRISYKE